MQQAITLPYLRTTPVHVPRRDLVLSAADSLLLSVTVVETDNPSAPVIILATDVNGPSMQLAIWNDTWQYHGWDYGRPYTRPEMTLRSITGTPGSAAGSWDFHVPTGTFADFPLRCGWAILLSWENGAKSSVLGQGIVHFMRPNFIGVPISAIPPDPGIPIVPPVQPSHVGLLTDDLHPIITSDTALQLETS